MAAKIVVAQHLALLLGRQTINDFRLGLPSDADEMQLSVYVKRCETARGSRGEVDANVAFAGRPTDRPATSSIDLSREA